MLRKLRTEPMTMSLEENAGQNHDTKIIKYFETTGKSKYLGTELNTSKLHCVISDFHREVDEICALTGNYAVYIGNSLPTFRANLSVKNPKILAFLTLEDGTDTLSRNVCKVLPIYTT
jgi:hypothetical protein